MDKLEFTKAFALTYLAARGQGAALDADEAERFIVRRDRAWCDYLTLLDHPEFTR